MKTTESDNGGSMQRMVSVLFGELKLSGCKDHPDRLDLSCCKIRRTDGTALTTKQVWEVLNELATAKHANEKVSESGTRDSRIETAAQSRPSLH